MATKLTIELDAEKYRAELNRVVEDTKTATGAIRGDAPDVNIKVTQTGAEKVVEKIAEIPDKKEVKTEIKSNDGAIDKTQGKCGKLRAALERMFGKGIGEQVGKGASAVSAIGTAAGASIPPVGVLGTVINALLSPIALITAAVTLLVSIGKAIWDKMTVSAEEAAASADAHAEAAGRELESVRALDQAAGEYADRLRELNGVEMTGNNVKVETRQILKNLEQEYGYLGAQIDAATGKVTNLDQVMARLEKRRRVKKMGALESSGDAALEQAKTKYMQARGADWFTTEGGAGQEFDSYLTASGEDLEYLRSMIRRHANDSGNDADQRSKYAEVLKSIDEVIETRKKQESVNETGYESAEESAAAYAKAAEKLRQNRKNYRDTARSNSDSQSDYEFGKLKDIDAKKSNREDRIKRAEADLESARKAAAATSDKGDATEADAKATAEHYAALQKVAEAEDKVVALKRQVKDLDDARAETVQKLTESAKYEVEYNSALLNGEYGKAEALKLQKELKSQNLKLTARETAEILNQRNALKTLQLSQNMRDKADSLRGKLMEQTGQGRDYALEKAIRDATKTKGLELTADELEQTKKLAALEYDMGHPGRSALDTIGDARIQTNSLTRRGGFAGGAVVPDKDDYNKAISSNTKKMAEQLKTTVDLLKEIDDNIAWS